MKNYIGTKIIKAEPKTDKEYSKFKGMEWGGEEKNGYMVLYPDGYISWSPKEVFEGAYREITQQEIESIIVPVKIEK